MESPDALNPAHWEVIASSVLVPDSTSNQEMVVADLPAVSGKTFTHLRFIMSARDVLPASDPNYAYRGIQFGEMQILG